MLRRWWWRSGKSLRGLAWLGVSLLACLLLAFQSSPAVAHDPALQATEYPPPSTESASDYPAPATATLAADYPAPDTTQFVTPTLRFTLTLGPTPLRTRTVIPTRLARGTVTPRFGQSQTPSAPKTPGKDLFRTEDAEIAGALVTIVSSDTPSPTYTPLASTPTHTAPAAASTPSDQASQDQLLDWKRFGLGFFIPILLGAVGLLAWWFFQN